MGITKAYNPCSGKCSRREVASKAAEGNGDREYWCKGSYYKDNKLDKLQTLNNSDQYFVVLELELTALFACSHTIHVARYLELQ